MADPFTSGESQQDNAHRWREWVASHRVEGDHLPVGVLEGQHAEQTVEPGRVSLRLAPPTYQPGPDADPEDHAPEMRPADTGEARIVKQPRPGERVELHLGGDAA
jgi:hypothetical protein